MKELTEKKAREITMNYINGNLSDAREAIKKLNKLQTVQLISRASNYDLQRHNMYTFVCRTLGE